MVNRLRRKSAAAVQQALVAGVIDATISGTVGRLVSQGNWPTHAGDDISKKGIKLITRLYNDHALALVDKSCWKRVGRALCGRGMTVV